MKWTSCTQHTGMPILTLLSAESTDVGTRSAGLPGCAECTSAFYGLTMRTGNVIYGGYPGAIGDGSAGVQGKPLSRRAPLSGRGTNLQNRGLKANSSRRYRRSHALRNNNLGNAFLVYS